MSTTMPDVSGTFSGTPEDIAVNAFPGSIDVVLGDPGIYISPELRSKFESVRGAPPKQTMIRMQPLRYVRSFAGLANEIPRDKMRFKLPDGLWYVAAMIVMQRNGGPGDLNLFTANAALLEDGMVVSVTFVKKQGWSLENLLEENLFQEGTQIIIPSP